MAKTDTVTIFLYMEENIFECEKKHVNWSIKIHFDLEE